MSTIHIVAVRKPNKYSVNFHKGCNTIYFGDKFITNSYLPTYTHTTLATMTPHASQLIQLTHV